MSDTPRTDDLILRNGKAIADGTTRPPIWKEMRQLELDLRNMTNLCDELVSLADTIDTASCGSLPWGNCRCDYGHDGRMPLQGAKCERCRASDRVKEIRKQRAIANAKS